MDRLGGKIAVITGAASGIGLSAMRRFVRESAQVLAVDRDGDRLEQAVEQALEQAANAGGDAMGFTADVTQPDQVERAVEAAVERYGGIDILLPNAGIWGTVAPIEEYPLDTFRRVLELNVTAVFTTMKYAVPHMARRGGGSIVITSSAAGVVGIAGTMGYSTSKHAVIGIMRVAAVELAKQGIRVNTVNPGPIDTPMMRELESGFFPEDPAQGAAALQSTTLLNRYGTAEEVAELMLYLASDESAYCTGGVYMLDGGAQLA